MIRAALLAVLVAVAVASTASAAHAAFPGQAGKLLLQSNRDGNYELYVAKADGSGVKKLLSFADGRVQRQLVAVREADRRQTGPPDRSS